VPFPPVLQEVAFWLAKDGLLPGKRWPFGGQKTVFRKTADYQAVTYYSFFIIYFSFPQA
jgi:hypothetical protein